MWSKREVAAKDYEIDRISAKDLCMKSFQQNYINKNIPVIITDLNLWNNKQHKSDINGIDKCLNSNYLLKNVFVTTNNGNRFLYFDKNNNSNYENKNNEQTQIRTKMTWNEFKQRILLKNKTNTIYKPYLNENENYYLYGESLPKSLSDFINIPSCLPLDDCDNKNENDNNNCLIWISRNGTVSPLHFDFCEGFLCQLNGIKRVCLFKFENSKFDNFYPYSFSTKYRRQSKINNIHKPNNKFKSFSCDKLINGYQGIINKNDGLYIPFGWWHQIESDNELGSISLSFRWNPYLNIIKNAILTCSKINNALVSNIIFNQCIQNTPFYIKNIAPIWKSLFNAKLNPIQDKDHDDNCDSDKEQKTESNIDLFDVD